MPNKLRQYEAYDGMFSQLKGLVKINILIVDLRTDALKERHWDKILKLLNLKQFSGRKSAQLTLGDIWKAPLKKNEDAIREVLVQCQGMGDLVEQFK